MKKLLLFMCVVLCGCATQYNEPESSKDSDLPFVPIYRHINFVVKGISVDYTSNDSGIDCAPRRISAATIQSENMTDLWVFEGSTLLCHQVSTDADFGAPTIALAVGAHDLTFVCSRSTGQAFDNGVWSCTKVSDTFGTVLAYTVSKSSSSKQVQLNRLVGKVQWTIEDALPSSAQSATIGISNQCYGLDASLNGVNPSVYSTNVNLSSYSGMTGLQFSVFVIGNQGGSDVTASITVNGQSGQLCEHETPVTVMPNRICNIHGNFFSSNVASAVVLNSVWGNTTDYAL